MSDFMFIDEAPEDFEHIAALRALSAELCKVIERIKWSSHPIGWCPWCDG